MTTWAELGLPCALRAGYGWQRDAGLARTPFADALPEQALARAKRRRTYRLAWALSGDQLALAEEHLLTYGYGRLGVLLTLPSAAGPVAVRLRLTEDLEVSAIRPGLFQLTCEAETLLTPARTGDLLCDEGLSIHVATAPYPFPVSDALASAARLLSAAAFRGIVENINTTALLTLGSVVNTLVPYTLEPEEIDTTAILTYVSIFSTLTTITLDPDNMDTTAILTFGSIEDTLVIYTHPSNDEKITSVGTLLSAIFE